MKIAEMNNCIEKMRECYNFDDNTTGIRLENFVGNNRHVSVCTRDKNGTRIEMTREIDDLLE